MKRYLLVFFNAADIKTLSNGDHEIYRLKKIDRILNKVTNKSKYWIDEN